MVFALPDGLAPEVYPLAWLVGSWHGEGAVGYPGIEQAAISQDIEFTHDGGPYLAYSASTRLIAPGGPVVQEGEAAQGEERTGAAFAQEPVQGEASGQVWHSESGYWRVLPNSSPHDRAHEIEVLVADPAGAVSVYVGEVEGPRINLATDLMAHTPSGAQMNAGKRMYGLVEGDLLWAWDLAAFGQPLQSYMSARLARVDTNPLP